MRAFLTITTTIIMVFTICMGCSKGSSPVLPDTHPDEFISDADLKDAQGSNYLLWMYDVCIDPESLDYTMEPVITRKAGEIGDSFEVEISSFMTGNFLGIECQDCLRIEKIGMHGNGDILLDMFMRHPFDSRAKRADLDVFDPRLILIVNGTDNRFILTNGVGIDDEPIVGNFVFLKNADGYTSHFDNRAEIEEFVGTPRNYQGNLNPYKYFFVDSDPDPLIFGKDNNHHRMRMGRFHDVQQLRLANPGTGLIEFVAAVEVSYVQSAKMHTRLSPIYHLPEGNQKEAYSIYTNLPRSLVETDSSPMNFNIFVEDWQNSTPTGPLRDQVRAQSDVNQVTVEIPGVSSSLSIDEFPDSGTGNLYDPYVFTIANMPVDLLPTQIGSPYLALIAVEDDYNDTLRADVYYNDEPLDDFVAYKVLPINVIAPGTCPQITIYNYSVNSTIGTCTITGEILYLDQTSTVTVEHGQFGDASTYRTFPLDVDFDGSFSTTVVLFVGSNEITIDATNQFCPDSVTIPLISYSPNPLPAFRVTLYWEPSVADPLDSTDMDLHLWNAAEEHCYYDNRTIDYAVLNIDDPDGYGPENIDGRFISGNIQDGFYPVAVNYYSNHRTIVGHSIDCTVRFLLNPGTPDQDVQEFSFTLTQENFNDPFDYPIGDSTASWYRVKDIGVLGNVASLYDPDTLHMLPGP